MTHLQTFCTSKNIYECDFFKIQMPLEGFGEQDEHLLVMDCEGGNNAMVAQPHSRLILPVSTQDQPP